MSNKTSLSSTCIAVAKLSWIGLNPKLKNNCWRTGWVQSRKKHHRIDLQPQNPVWKVPPIPAESVPCLHRFQNSLWQSMTCSPMATMRKYNISANLVRTIEQLYDKATSAVQMNGSIGEMVQNNSRSKARMSSVTHPLQHFSRTDHVWCPGRTWWEG